MRYKFTSGNFLIPYIYRRFDERIRLIVYSFKKQADEKL
jgi:hypothetical protein